MPETVRRSPLPTWLRAPLAISLAVASTVVHVLPLLVVALFKALLPLRPIRRGCDRLLARIAASWIDVNTFMVRAMMRTRFVVELPETLRPDGHYLVLANHQSWTDIPVLQAIFNRRIPMLRFFLKSELFWVPLLGLAWWALEFPFMKRYSREKLKRRPELAGRDIEATRRACRRFRDQPVSLTNFLEGTRFTPEKHARQASPFTHLLKPRAGAMAFVLDVMGDALHSILDVTIAYPEGRPSVGDVLADRIPEVRVHVRELPIPAELLGGDYESDRAFRARVHAWLNTLWQTKDATVTHLLAAPAHQRKLTSSP